MKEQLEKLKKDALTAIEVLKDGVALENLYNKILGRKNGELTELMKSIKDLSLEAKKIIGPLANDLKNEIEELFKQKREKLWQDNFQSGLEKERIDITQPALPKITRGSYHPNTIVQRELEELFVSMGFTVVDGPELESDYYNFEALNIPVTHPARDSHDTFYIKNHLNWLMRTHTSPVQVRALQKYGAPLRIIAPGRCFRNEATDACHEHTFYQLEGLVVDKNISIANLIDVMKKLLSGVFKKEVEVRMRPGFFPFVEPGFELDMKCLVCKGDGCGACKHGGWIEVLPCGLVHPKVIQAGGLDPKIYSGFAFGLGMTRLVMQKFGIGDIRVLQSGKINQ
jgi:phenylalanyl-tRNA synthetase alpha chain